MQATVGKNSRVLLMCAIGGTLDTLVSYRREKKLFNDPERQFGRGCLFRSTAAPPRAAASRPAPAARSRPAPLPLPALRHCLVLPCAGASLLLASAGCCFSRLFLTGRGPICRACCRAASRRAAAAAARVATAATNEGSAARPIKPPRRPGPAPPAGESRSLKAAYELLEAGWSPSNVRHVDGGFQQWRYKGLPMEDSLPVE
jgi:hypothetical protein